MTVWRYVPGGRVRTILVASALIGCTLGGAVAVSAQGDPQPTIGSVPFDRLNSNGLIDSSDMPDFLRKVDSNGNIYGFAKSSDMFPEFFGGTPTDKPYPIYDKSLTNVIGSYHPGIGFVPAGKSIDSPDVQRQAPPSTRVSPSQSAS